MKEKIKQSGVDECDLSAEERKFKKAREYANNKLMDAHKCPHELLLFSGEDIKEAYLQGYEAAEEEMK